MEPAADIAEACRLVRGRLTDPTARLTVAIETGPDEAILVGTADAYLRLALAALEFVADAQAGRSRRLSIGGVSVAGTMAFEDVVEYGEVALAAGWLVETSGDVRAVAEYMLKLSPPAGQGD